MVARRDRDRAAGHVEGAGRPRLAGAGVVLGFGYLAGRDRPVWLRAGIGIQQSAAGTGVFTVQINETTSGTTLIGEAVAPLPGTTTNGYMSKEAAIRLGPTTAQRTFKLSVGCIAFSGTPQFAILNGAVSHAFRSWLLAEAK